MNPYDKSTWPSLKDMRQRLRDKLFDMHNADSVTLAAIQKELDSVELRLRQGETHEFPW